MMASCCAILGIIFLVITNLAIIISYSTPYWLDMSNYLFPRENRGLWATCQDDHCTWAFQNNMYLQKTFPVWWVAIQALMSFGLFLGLMGLLIATLALCCDCKGCNSSHAVAGILMIGFLVMGVAVVIFGIKAHNDMGAVAEFERKNSNRFSWSFYLAISAATFSLFTSLIYACDGRNRH